MVTTTNQLLTAADLMTRDVKTVHATTPLREAAAELVRPGIHGLPVVDDSGQCIGMLSVSDLARWASATGAKVKENKTCPFQETYRQPGGREVVACDLAQGMCHFQVRRETQTGSLLACSEPRGVPTEWQMVSQESGNGNQVRDYMTTTIFSVSPETHISDLARQMLDHGVHRLLVLNGDRRLVGIVAVDDLLQVLAHPELAEVGEPG